MEITIVQQRATPFAQFIVAVAIALLCMTIAHLFNSGLGFEFFGAFIGIIFFAIINTVVSVFNPYFRKYTLPSYAFYVLLLVTLLLSAKFISGQSIWMYGEYRMMAISVSMFYFISSVLVRMVRFILEMAESDRN